MKSKVASALPQLLLALLVLAIVASLGVAGLRLRERLNAPPPDTPNAAHALASTTERALLRVALTIGRLQTGEAPVALREAHAQLAAVLTEAGASTPAASQLLALPDAAAAWGEARGLADELAPLVKLPQLDAPLLAGRFVPRLDATAARIGKVADAADAASRQPDPDHNADLRALIALALAGLAGLLLAGTLAHRQSQLARLREQVAHGIAERTVGQQQTSERLVTLSHAIEQSPAIVLIADASGCVEYANPRFETVTGYPVSEILGKRVGTLPTDRLDADERAQMWADLSAGKIWQRESESRTRRDDPYWERTQIAPVRDLQGELTHFVVVKEDVSERKQFEAKLLRQARYDELTGLPNRLLAMERLTAEIDRSDRADGAISALLFVDVQGLKRVNDSYGHSFGDRLLVAIGMRLLERIGRHDMVARFGGDEFLLLLARRSDAGAVRRFAKELVKAFTSAIDIQGQQVHTSITVGGALAPLDGRDADTLLRCADTARSHAKAEGGSTCRFYDESMRRRALETAQLDNLLRGALERNEFSLAYQPVVDLASGRPIGAEALLRWNSPVLGPVSPDRFIQLAEETSLIVPIGEWVLEQACRELAAWREMLNLPLHMAINVSSRQFHDYRFVDRVQTILQNHELPGDAIVLELTERLFLGDDGTSIEVMRELAEQGVRIAIDDFGTGYSSLSYLSRFPVHLVKIDRAFVKGLPEDSESAGLSAAIVAMAGALGLEVICEGVETPEQQTYLAGLGAQHGQGWLFGKPLPSADIRQLLLNRASSAPAA